MEIMVCKNCKRLFHYMFGAQLCPVCSKQVLAHKVNDTEVTTKLHPVVLVEEEDYARVRDYIMEHPNATVAQVATELEISPTKIFEWIREGRIELSEREENR